MALVTHSYTGVYPMDSVELTVDADGLPVYDRPYNAADLRRFNALMTTDGVFPKYLTELKVSTRGGSWYVGGGAAMASGLLVPVPSEVKVADQSDVPTGQYMYVCVAGRFDVGTRDGFVYARLSASPSEAPVRTDSVHELILARVDWRGTLTDYRADQTRCGIVNAVNEIDAESFMEELKTAVSQFNLNVGTVSVLPPGTTPEVVVRKPEVAGEPVYIDFGIPRGPQGDRGEDGDRAPAVYIRDTDHEPPMARDNVWMVDDKETHTITAIKAAEVDDVYPEPNSYPSEGFYPGGVIQWVDHKLSPSVIAS